MAREIETREAGLCALNQELEQRLEERTAELARAHSLQQIILESIADGVVVVDREGRFLLWNAKTEQIVGGGPDQVAPVDELRTLIRHRNQPAAPVGVNRAVDSCLQFLRGRIERLGVAVDCRYRTALPRPMGDPIELSHVLVQLVSSSLEALGGIERAERRLSVGTSHGPEAGVVQIEVADSRRSVHPELEKQLVDPLPPEKPDAPGIGLYIARAIVDNY